MTQPVPPPPTTPMVTREGAVVDVPVSEAADAYLTGKLGFADNAPVVLTIGGEHKVFSPEEAGQLLDRSQGVGVGIAHPGAYQEQEERKQFETLPHEAAALGLGAARGLTIGLSDPVISALGGQQYLEKQEKYNPGLGTAGEIGGMLLPAVLSGGSSAAAEGGIAGASAAAKVARVAGAPMRAVAALGEGAGGLATRAGVAAGLTEGGTVARAVGATAQGMAEGALYGVGNAASQAAIHDEDLTAEKILAAGGHGALLGGLLGGGASLGASGVVGAVRGVGALGAHALERAGELAEHLGGGLPTLETFAERKALQSTGANLGQLEALREMEGRVVGTEARAAQQITEDLPAIAGKPSLANMSHAEMEIAAEKNAMKKGAEVGTLIRDLDQLQKEVSPDLNLVKERLNELHAKLEGTFLAESEAKEVGKTIASFEKKIQDDSFETLWKARRALDDTIVWKGPAADSLLNKTRIEMRRILEDEITAGGERAAQHIGAEFSARYVKAKQDFQAANWVREATAKGAKAEARNRSIGMSEHLTGMAGSNALGSAVGSVLGPAGALAGNLVGGAIAGAVANHVRRYGDQIAATVAKRAIQSDLVSAISRTVDEHVGAGVSAFLGSARKGGESAAAAVKTAWRDLPSGERLAVEADQKRRGRPPKTAPLAERFEEAAKRTVAASAHPVALVAGAAAGIADGAPGVASKLEARATQTTANLLARMPKQKEISSLQPNPQKLHATPAQMQAFLDYERGATKPLSLVDDMRHGVVRPDVVAGVRENSPLLFAEIQRAVAEQIPSLQRQLSYQEQLKISQLFGVPVHPSQSPEFLRVMSLVMNAPPTQQKAAPKKPVNPQAGAATASEQIEQKESA